MNSLAPNISESTIRFDGPHGLPSDFDPGMVRFSIPAVTTQAEAFTYGYGMGELGLDPQTADLPLDLVDYALDGHAAGVADQLNRALLDVAPTDGELVEGSAEWADLPSPEELAHRIRRVVCAMTGRGHLASFLRAALTNIAGDVEAFEARTYNELQAREWEMAETAFTPVPCSCHSEGR